MACVISLIYRSNLYELSHSFITPIDREDIVRFANELDDITDSIEDVAKMFNMFIITSVRPDAKNGNTYP